MTLQASDGPDEEARAEDRALLQAHLAGDPEAFGTLFARHRDRLWAVALRTTGQPEDAADALQDALISAFRRADTFRGDAAVTTWLHRIVVNASLDRLRRQKVRAADPLPDDLEEHAARGDVLATPAADDPAALVVAHERRRRVHAALEELPPDQKAALVLVDLQGYPVLEAALILEVPAGTVKSRCARGRTRLAALLGDLAPGADPREGGTAEAPAASHRGPPTPPAPARGQPHAPDPQRDPETRPTRGGEQ